MSSNICKSSETIVAPMTPAGVSAIAALRVSGAKVVDVLRALFGEKALLKLIERQAVLATAKDFSCNKIIDNLLYIYYKSPNSYTGEDVLELFPHGNPLIVRNLIKAICNVNGVRLAEPGEYTKRAFLNGKMDLIQAESVAEVIHSANAFELENAHRLLNGAMSKKIAALISQVKDISARLELDVDFTEEEADPDYNSWELKLNNLKNSIVKILESFKGCADLKKLPTVVLYGVPNAGKSSLANALIGEDRILVSNIAGTTRDFVEVRLFFDSGEIRLIDTAGISQIARDDLDAMSMQKSKEILECADLKILLVDATCPHIEISNFMPNVIAISKVDIAKDLANEIVKNLKNKFNVPIIKISSKTNEGVIELKQIIENIVFRKSSNNKDLWLTSEREMNSLKNALEGVKRALNILKTNPAVELLAFEMQIVRRDLVSITGEITSDEILQSIFAGFCIGK